jgi:hypothetical protein
MFAYNNYWGWMFHDNYHKETVESSGQLTATQLLRGYHRYR